MKKYAVIMILVLMSFFANGQAFAKPMAVHAKSEAQEEPAFPSSDRHGFFLTLAPVLGHESDVFDQSTFGANLELGVGIQDQMLFFLKISNLRFEDDWYEQAYTYNFASLNIQYFFTFDQKKSFYLRGGLGSAIVSVEDYESELGYMVEFGAGYEIRIGRKFFVSPELYVHYNKIEDVEITVPSFAFKFGWYF